MTARGASGVLAGLLLLVGVVLGFTLSPSLHDPVLGTISCGAPFRASTDADASDMGSAMANVATDFAGQCSSALTGPRIATFSLIGIGGVGLLFFLLTMKGLSPTQEPERQPAAEESA